MTRYISCFLLLLILNSCGPTFNIQKEKSNISDFVEGKINIDNQFKILPKNIRDTISIDKFLKYNDSLLGLVEEYFFNTDAVVDNSFSINKVSQTKKIKDNYFKIIHIETSTTLNKNIENIYLYDLKEFLNQNLIQFIDDETNLNGSIKVLDSYDLLTIYDSKSKKWNYMFYNESAVYRIFGLKATQKIIQLYFDEIFIPAKEKWDQESIKIFKNIYSEIKNEEQYQNLDFDKYCDCLIKHNEKTEEENNEIPDEYYDSFAKLEIIYRCRIYSAYSIN